MKAVLLAGGRGSRLSEVTDVRPKPMVEIGGMPILWHIMKHLSSHGIDEFVICLGYKGYVIKEYFANYNLHRSDLTIDMASGEVSIESSSVEPWKVTLVDTGEHTQTGGRLRRVLHHVANEDEFLFTYGDGLSDVDVGALVAHHRAHGKQATVTAVRPPGRYGVLDLSPDLLVRDFREKSPGDGGWINGGYFILSPTVGDHLHGDDAIWEREPVDALASREELTAYQHHGWWQPMDTLRDRDVLEALWEEGSPPWRTWT